MCYQYLVVLLQVKFQEEQCKIGEEVCESFWCVELVFDLELLGLLYVQVILLCGSLFSQFWVECDVIVWLVEYEFGYLC